MLTRKKFVELDLLLTFDGVPVRRSQLGACSECRGVKLPTHRTVTVQNVGQRTVDFELDTPAETTTCLLH